MLSLFTIPRSFKGEAGLRQRNAIRSWTRLHPACEILLCGDDPGVAAFAEEHALVHLPEVARNEFGTPVLADAFSKVKAAARHPLLCYANADILFLPDMVRAVRGIRLEQFMALGRRWNIDQEGAIRFDACWAERLRERVASEGELDVPGSMDYFIFPKQVLGRLLEVMPPFVVGRPWWDTWMIFQARRYGYPVIDLTSSVLAVHQRHDYTHVPQQRVQVSRKGGEAQVVRKWHGPEGDRNRRLAGEDMPRCTVHDATHTLQNGRVEPALADPYLHHRIKRLAVIFEARRGSSEALLQLVMRVLLVLYHRRRYLPDPLWRLLAHRFLP